MTKSKYQGVILAAGHGTRMGPFGDLFPKPIVPICNQPLLVYQIEYMRQLGIDEVFIVIGHRGHLISQLLGDGSTWGVTIRYVEQERRLGIAHAVGILERHLDRPFLLMLGDIFFEMTDVGRMVREFEEHQASAVLAVKEETDPEAVKRNFAVILHEDGTVRRVIEKPRHVPNMLKGCGVYLFDLPIFDAIRRTPRTAMRDEYELTDSIQILIDYDYRVRVAPVVDWDTNVTVIGDLIRCCVHELKKRHAAYVLGESCAIADGVEFVESCVGDNVTISRPARLERCVVFPGARLDEGRDLTDAVVTQHATLRAGHD
ncbi:MAG: NTP transferase domain-containing protein [Candidatus Hydrogenedentes bacterium]|nr:NTP transferase domain-containing protein [Candidatus Hydrogenedentota bacterium]